MRHHSLAFSIFLFSRVFIFSEYSCIFDSGLSSIFCYPFFMLSIKSSFYILSISIFYFKFCSISLTSGCWVFLVLSPPTCWYNFFFVILEWLVLFALSWYLLNFGFLISFLFIFSLLFCKTCLSFSLVVYFFHFPAFLCFFLFYNYFCLSLLHYLSSYSHWSSWFCIPVLFPLWGLLFYHWLNFLLQKLIPSVLQYYPVGYISKDYLYFWSLPLFFTSLDS